MHALTAGEVCSRDLPVLGGPDDPDPPWLRYYGKVPHSLNYPELTLYEAVAATAARVPDDIAWDFLDTTSSYRAFLASIDTCANALAALGLAAGERILISMPTSPQGVIAFYAANKLGALPALIHPLSTAPEIEHYLNASRARIALTLDAFYARFSAVKPELPLEKLILARIPDYLSPVKKFGFGLSKGRKIPRRPVRRARALVGRSDGGSALRRAAQQRDHA